MPNLQWQEIREFGGLWTAGSSYLMPATSAQVMSGCHPQPGGGLRAFLKVAETVDANDIAGTGGTHTVPVGFGISVKAGVRGVSAPTFFLVVANDSSLLYWALWRREADEAATGWSRSTSAEFDDAATWATTPPATQPQFARMIDLSVGAMRDYLAMNVREQDGDASGLYWIDGGDGSATRITSDFSTSFGAVGLVEHQARLVAGYQDVVKFSAPGAPEDFSGDTAGYVRLNPEGWLTNAFAAVHEGPLVAWLVSVPPGDLIVATRDGRVYNVQGDLGDPTVRELGRWTTMLPHEPVNTPNGLFFILPNLGVARLGLDGSVDIVSDDILPSIWNLRSHPQTGLGQLAATERFLFAPNAHASSPSSNGPLVMDLETGAWFTATHPDDYTITKPLFMQPDNNPRDSGIWVVSQHSPDGVAGGDSTALLFHYRTGGYDSASLSSESRGETWEWKSAPFRDQSGRQIVVREVEIPVYAANSASTLALTVGGTTYTKTLPSGRSLQRFVLRYRGEYADFTVKAKSNASGVEAPIMEALRIGTRPGHLI